MLIWFRSERVRTVTWGGDPTKSVSDSDDPTELSPRRSFAQWHQIVKGTSDPWTAGDIRAAQFDPKQHQRRRSCSFARFAF